jgi:hypothetical protein
MCRALTEAHPSDLGLILLRGRCQRAVRRCFGRRRSVWLCRSVGQCWSSLRRTRMCTRGRHRSAGESTSLRTSPRRATAPRSYNNCIHFKLKIIIAVTQEGCLAYSPAFTKGVLEVDQLHNNHTWYHIYYYQYCYHIAWLFVRNKSIH